MAPAADVEVDVEKKHHVTLKPKERGRLEQMISAGGGSSCAPNRPRVRRAMLDFDDMGRADGRRLGPKPGMGAVLHDSSGEADFDGLPGDELPPREAVKRKLKEDAPAPPERSAD